MDRIPRCDAGGIGQLRSLIAEHSLALEADLIRMGMRLRWVGDGTARLTLRDLWALVQSFIRDETSALFRVHAPDGYIPLAHQLASDQVNATMLLNHNLRRAFGDKKTGKWKPLRTYPGSPFDPPEKTKLLDPGASLGGYRRMSRAETVEWLKSRGLPTPST